MKNKESEKIELEKKQLRKYIQNKRNSLSVKEREKKSKAAAENFFEIKYYLNSKNILIYYPFRSEIDTTIIIKDALHRGKNIILPRVSKHNLDLYFVNDLSTQLEKGSFDIMEPIPSLCKSASIKDIDLTVVPGIGFDKKLNRLGYGGGFYDKLLSKLPESVKRIAIAFEIQIVPYIPTYRHDKKVDILITESKIYYP